MVGRVILPSAVERSQERQTARQTALPTHIPLTGLWAASHWTDFIPSLPDHRSLVTLYAIYHWPEKRPFKWSNLYVTSHSPHYRPPVNRKVLGLLFSSHITVQLSLARLSPPDTNMTTGHLLQAMI